MSTIVADSIMQGQTRDQKNFRRPEKELGAISQVGLERGPLGGNSRRAKERMDHVEGRGERMMTRKILRKQSCFVTG